MEILYAPGDVNEEDTLNIKCTLKEFERLFYLVFDMSDYDDSFEEVENKIRETFQTLQRKGFFD